MNNFYRVDLLWHAWKVHTAMAEFGGSASLDMGTFEMDVQGRERHYRLYPRFVVRHGDQLVYVRRPIADMAGFGGWLPYMRKRWPIGTGKRAFKAFCAENALRTPRIWRTPEPGMRDFLVKKDLSSSGDGMCGPFASYDPANPRQRISDDAFYEQFIPGTIIKAWYWEDRLVAVTAYGMPSVTGNGAQSLRELVRKASQRDLSPGEWTNLEEVARYQGLALDDVPVQGREVLSDFRYASAQHRGVHGTQSPLELHRDAPFMPELLRVGPIFWAAIPGPLRPASLYSVDAIVEEQNVWLLELNCNPAVHPEAYAPMLETLFGPRQAGLTPVRAPDPLPASALPTGLFPMPPGAALQLPMAARPLLS